MKYLVMLLTLVFSVSLFAGKDCALPTAGGTLLDSDADALKDFMDGQCHDDGYPDQNAYLYIEALKQFTHDYREEIQTVSGQFTDSAQNKHLGNMKEKISKTTPTSYYDKAFSEGLGLLPGGKALKFGYEQVKKRAEAGEAPDPNESYDTIAGQFGQVNTISTDFMTNLSELHNQLERIQARLTPNPTKTVDLNSLGLEADDKDLARRIFCSFKSPMGPLTTSDRESCEGPKGVDYNSERGKLSCKDVTPYKEKNSRRALLRSSVANFAGVIANGIIVKDKHAIMKEGAPSRIEIVADLSQTSYSEARAPASEHSPYVVNKLEIKFQTPGGEKLICTLAKDPKYKDHWEKKGGKMVMKSSLKLNDLGLPVVIHNKRAPNLLTNYPFQIEANGKVKIAKKSWCDGAKCTEVTQADAESFAKRQTHTWKLPLKDHLKEDCSY